MGFGFGKGRGGVVCLWQVFRIVNRSYEPIIKQQVQTRGESQVCQYLDFRIIHLKRRHEEKNINDKYIMKLTGLVE